MVSSDCKLNIFKTQTIRDVLTWWQDRWHGKWQPSIPSRVRANQYIRSWLLDDDATSRSTDRCDECPCSARKTLTLPPKIDGGFARKSSTAGVTPATGNTHGNWHACISVVQEESAMPDSNIQRMRDYPCETHARIFLRCLLHRLARTKKREPLRFRAFKG